MLSCRDAPMSSVHNNGRSKSVDDLKSQARRPQTVMLVEDEPEIREMLSYALTRAGFSAVTAGSAEEALELLDGQQPAVVIIDWMLPGASGLELARRLRRDELF